MNKTLLFMSTHFVDEAIISEYKKCETRRTLTQFWRLTITLTNTILRSELKIKIFTASA